MGQIYICWKGNQVHYETIKKLLNKRAVHHTQHQW